MTEVQLILAGDTPEDQLRWALVKDGNVVKSAVAESLRAFSESAHNNGAETVLILPGERFVARHISSPAKSKQQFLQSVRFILEDDLGGGIDGLHVCCADDSDNTIRAVIGVQREWLQLWLDEVSDLGINVKIVTADFLLMPKESETAAILLDNDRLMYNASGEGFVTEQAFARDLVEDLITQKGITKVILLSRILRNPFNLPGVEVEHFQIKDEHALMVFYAASLQKQKPANLLQGEFEPGIDWMEFTKPWRLAGALLAACIVLYFGMLLGEAIKFNAAADRITAQAEDRFRAAYPDMPIRNLRSQARQLAGAGEGGGSQFLPLSALLTASLETVGGAELSLLNYSEDGSLEVELQFATIDDLDRLKEALIGSGLSVDEGRSLTPSGNGYSGRLTVRSAA
ncbi:MAG: type II secretion system protein GspL [Aquisalinus sp.]|nr:type II secretion system protein GspL [Aquisalinus sp.]